MQSVDSTKNITEMPFAAPPRERERFVAQAEQLRKDADQCELKLDIYGAAYCHTGAAVFYEKAGMIEESKHAWGSAAEMFELSINSSFGPDGMEESLSVEDWRNVMRRSKEVAQASDKSGTKEDLKTKYENITNEIRDSLDEGAIPNWSRIMR